MNLSRTLSWLLRHGAAKEGLIVDSAGWVPIDQVLERLKIGEKELFKEVEEDTKNRLEVFGSFIRCCQGHSTEMPVRATELEKTWEPYFESDTIWHATNLTPFPKIKRNGLKPMDRTHVHLAPSRSSYVGKRQGAALLIVVSTKLLRDCGYEVFQASNGVVLVREVPTSCIVKVIPRTKKAKEKVKKEPKFIPKKWR